MRIVVIGGSFGGRRWLWAKRAYERYCLWRMKRGWAGSGGLLS